MFNFYFPFAFAFALCSCQRFFAAREIAARPAAPINALIVSGTVLILSGIQF